MDSYLNMKPDLTAKRRGLLGRGSRKTFEYLCNYDSNGDWWCWSRWWCNEMVMTMLVHTMTYCGSPAQGCWGYWRGRPSRISIAKDVEEDHLDITLVIIGIMIIFLLAMISINIKLVVTTLVRSVWRCWLARSVTIPRRTNPLHSAFTHLHCHRHSHFHHFAISGLSDSNYRYNLVGQSNKGTQFVNTQDYIWNLYHMGVYRGWCGMTPLRKGHLLLLTAFGLTLLESIVGCPSRPSWAQSPRGWMGMCTHTAGGGQHCSTCTLWPSGFHKHTVVRSSFYIGSTI